MRYRGRVVRVAWLCRKSQKGREFKAGLYYDYWKTFSVNPAVNGDLFRIKEKIRQRKERDWLRLSLAVPMIQWDSNSTAHTAIRLWKTFTLTLRWGLFGVFFSCLWYLWFLLSISGRRLNVDCNTD